MIYKYYILFFLFSFVSCTCNKVEQQNTEVSILSDTTLALSLSEIQDSLVKQEGSKKANIKVVELKKTVQAKIDSVQQLNSYFKQSFECCNEPTEKLDNCCCDKVLAWYKEKILKSEFQEITKITTADPIFKACNMSNKFKVEISKLDAVE